MNFKRIFAVISATAIAATMAISASAAITNDNVGGSDAYKYQYDVTLPDGVKYNDVYGAVFTYTGTPEEGQTNAGAIVWQSGNVSWSQKEFGLPTDEDVSTKPLVFENNSVTMLNDEPLFAEEEEWAQVLVVQWIWDGCDQMDFTVDSVKLLDKDGNVIGESTPANEDDKQKEEDTKPAEDENKPAEDDKPAKEESKPSDKNAATGVGSGLAFAGIALAGAAIVASKKSK